MISIFDAFTGKEKSSIPLAVDEYKPYCLPQINKIVVNESEKLIIAGTEDKLIRLFDLNSHK